MGNLVSTVGKVYSMWGAIVGTVFSLLLIGLGIFLISRKNVFTKFTKGTVLSASCRPEIENQSIKYKCVISVTYTINMQPYTGTVVSVTDSPPSKGDVLELAYNPANPKEVEIYNPLTTHRVGWILSGVGVLIIIGLWVNVWLTRRSKLIAGVEGLEGVGEMLRQT